MASPVMRRSATRPVSVLTQTLILRVEEAGSGDRRHDFSHFRVPRPPPPPLGHTYLNSCDDCGRALRRSTERKAVGSRSPVR